MMATKHIAKTTRPAAPALATTGIRGIDVGSVEAGVAVGIGPIAGGGERETCHLKST